MKSSEKAFYKKTGARLKKLRKEAKVGQKAVAGAAGCTTGYISAVERGESRLSALVLMAYAETLNTSPNHLLGYKDGHIPEIEGLLREISEKSEKLSNLFTDLI